MRNVKKVFSQNMLKLTTAFLNLVSNEPTYPKLNFPCFVKFCNNLNLLT